MFRTILLAVLTLSAAAQVQAADLPPQSRLGAVFAEPAPAPVAVYVGATRGYPAIYAPPVHIPPLVAGYYGKPDSYIYRPYYGESLYWNFARLPYGCGFHGYC